MESTQAVTSSFWEGPAPSLGPFISSESESSVNRAAHAVLSQDVMPSSAPPLAAGPAYVSPLFRDESLLLEGDLRTLLSLFGMTDPLEETNNEHNKKRLSLIFRELLQSPVLSQEEKTPLLSLSTEKVLFDADRLCLLLRIAQSNNLVLLSLSADYFLSSFNGSFSEKVCDLLGSFEEVWERKTVLDCSEQGITAIPEQIFSLTGLKEMKLVKNQISFLSPSVGGLCNLKHLFLSKNQFKTFPAAVGLLVGLTILDLRDNQIEDVPGAVIGRLVNLKGLVLSGNLLKTLPVEIGNLDLLEILNLCKNPIESLPAEVGQPLDLKICISNEHVEKIPPSFEGKLSVSLC